MAKRKATAKVVEVTRVTDAAVEAFANEYWGHMVWEQDDLPNIRRALEAALPHMPAVRWQPIETAPKDGTRILLLGLPNEAQGGLPQIATGHWRKFSGSRYPGAWCWVHSVSPSLKITHWMSAPPPAPSEKGGL